MLQKRLKIVEINIDLDSGLASVSIDGSCVETWDWTGNLGGVNFFGNAGTCSCFVILLVVMSCVSRDACLVDVVDIVLGGDLAYQFFSKNKTGRKIHFEQWVRVLCTQFCCELVRQRPAPKHIVPHRFHWCDPKRVSP